MGVGPVATWSVTTVLLVPVLFGSDASPPQPAAISVNTNITEREVHRAHAAIGHLPQGLSSAAAYAVDLTTVSFRRAAGTAVTNGDGSVEGVVSFGWGRRAIIKALGGGCGINSLRDEFCDVDDPLALVDAYLHVITHSHR